MTDHAQSIPEMQQIGQFFEFTWRPERIRMHVNHIRQVAGGAAKYEARVQVLSNRPGEQYNVYDGTVLISDDWRRKKCAEACNAKSPGLDWVGMVETACIATLDALNEGEPLVTLASHELTTVEPWLLYPVLREGKPTIIFGKGGTMKSLLAAYIAVQVSHGLECKPANVLILDWESDADDWLTRIRMICEGMGVEVPANVHHKFCAQMLTDDIDEIKRIVIQNDIGLVIVDSAAMAVLGSVIDTGAIIAFFTALRALRTTSLVIGHQNAQENTQKPFGNLMWENQVRLTFQTSKVIREDGVTQVGAFQRKANVNGNIPPLGYDVQFIVADPLCYTPGDSIIIAPANVEDNPEFEGELSLAKRILLLLESEGKMAGPDIAKELKANPGSVRMKLSSLQKSGKVSKVMNEWCIRAADGTYREVPQPVSLGGNHANPW